MRVKAALRLTAESERSGEEEPTPPAPADAYLRGPPMQSGQSTGSFFVMARSFGEGCGILTLGAGPDSEAAMR
jgi:hypothetical protein